MSFPPPICQACQEPITEPMDVVVVGHEVGNSGPGWMIYAHQAHADSVPLIDYDLLRIMSRIWAVQQQQGA